MLIKRVVIQGFKTFAKRTEFVFDPGITAVVGPNGSGKSNIVDAVRWCLGEQSFSLLRSKRSSDIIFSGSDKRSRLGMAQVSLTLDNGGGEIPIDFAEVEITRRAYRDGDNEYLVNGSRVRLSDVTELLAQTGLGKRTYAVIGQGLIDKVLSLAPEERRSLFEEAAGITGYQIKRDTALRRLDATQLNLTRVRDITAELAPRISTLRRQAERAREREQLAADLRSMLREWYGFKWHHAIAGVEDLAADAKILRNTLDERQLLLDREGAAAEQLRAEQSTLRERLGEHHRAAGSLHQEAEQVGRELAVGGERRRQLHERSEEVRHELEPQRIEQSALLERIERQKQGAAEAEAQLAEQSAAVASLERELSLRTQARDQWEAEVDAARAAVDGLRRRQAEGESRLAQATDRDSSLTRAADGLRAGLASAEGEAAALAAEVDAAAQAHAALEREGATLAEEVAALEEERLRLRRELEEAESRRREGDREVDRLQNRLDLLNRLAQEGAGMASGVRAALQANLPGLIGVVGTLLQARPEHDRAVETALGGALQNIVAESWDDAHSAIEFLKQGRHGRATFLPLNRLQTGARIAAPHMAGVLGNAADLVDCDPRAVEARDHLLNRTWFVESLPVARQALDTLRGGPRPTVVTLAGEIVRPGGAVTGGSDGDRRDDSSMLARERERRALPTQVEAAMGAASAAAEACRTLAATLATSAGRREELQRTQADVARRERSAREARDEARRRSDRAAQSQRYLAEQVAANAAEVAALRAERDGVTATLAAVEAELTAATARLREVEAAGSAQSSDELLRSLADLRAAEAAARGVVESRRALLEQQVRSAAALAQQIGARAARLVELEREAETLAARLSLLAERDHALNAQIAALQTRSAPDENRLAALESEQAACESRERALLHEQRRDETAWAHAQLALQRAEDAVHQLRSDIQRDLGLVAVEQSDELPEQPPLPWDAFVEQLPVRERVPDGLEEEMGALRARLARLVNVNPSAPQEFDEASARFEHLTTQSDDLERAAADLHKIIAELDVVMRSELARTFAAVAVEFQREFRTLFNGGSAELVLTDPDNLTATGVEITARPPGKRPQSLALLSGGERTLAAMALIFAILRVSPTPFCVLDEVDAALDEANVDRFRLAVDALSQGTQFIIVTHNRRTLEGSSTIYGVTMGDDGVSKVISLRLEGDHIVHHAPGAANGDATPDDLAVLEQTIEM
jgi:chromosome segregation protein